MGVYKHFKITFLSQFWNKFQQTVLCSLQGTSSVFKAHKVRHTKGIWLAKDFLLNNSANAKILCKIRFTGLFSHLSAIVLELLDEGGELVDDLGGEVLRDHLVLPGLVAQLVQQVAVGQGVGVPRG